MSEKSFLNTVIMRHGKPHDWYGRQISEEQAKKLRANTAESSEPSKESENVAGSGIPAEESLLANGLVTFGDVLKNLDVLTDIDGVGPKTAESIKSFLKVE